MAPSLKRKSEAALAASTDAKKPKVNASITSFFGPPKNTSSTTSTTPNNKTSNASSFFSPNNTNNNPQSSPASSTPQKFDKAKWVATLTPDQKKHLALEIQTLDPSWLAVLKDEILKPEFMRLKKFLENEVKSGKKVFPPREDVYSWSRHTPFHTVKAVIIGQDPYHNHNQAHGLCFSVRPPQPAPPSLKNMYTALKKDYPGSFAPPPNNGGLLTPWAEQGVLMLNTCLTVRAHEANSHANRGWEAFTQRAIDLVAQKRTRGVVFLAWGTPAGKRVTKVDAGRHLVLRSVHPSPLSAHRGFLDCGHFKKANEWLAQRYGEDGVIDWDLSPKAKKIEERVETKEDKKNVTEAKAEVPAPVVAVGKVDEEGKEEKSEVLEKEGEDGTVDADEAK
ncbi:Uu.00g027980.m01.CDS01 [Anthostomella pinea]|uniref:Uracil-DNA glycosylase n=1 Tax=Anthostomella pinea TaxID=933095 RepID=A0AAI8V8U5_9PEZI|nr:Uu.00g027980.m01.CDS01 [Anthostomella pinea]